MEVVRAKPVWNAIRTSPSEGGIVHTVVGPIGSNLRYMSVIAYAVSKEYIPWKRLRSLPLP